MTMESAGVSLKHLRTVIQIWVRKAKNGKFVASLVISI